jgi:putative transposase
MKSSRFTKEQIIGILKEQEAGAKTADVYRRYGISDGTFYKWKSKFGGLEVSEVKRLKALEDENAKLKKLLAEAMLDNAILKDIAKPLRARLRALAAERRRFGYRRLGYLLAREGLAPNHKKLLRTYREEGLKVRRRGGRKRALGTRSPLAVPQGRTSAGRWTSSRTR